MAKRRNSVSKVPPQLREGIADLKAARAYITPPHRWTRGVYIQGNIKDPDVTVCSVGALQKVQHNRNLRTHTSNTCAFNFLSKAVRKHYGPTSIEGWNDRGAGSHSEVLTMWDKAIAMAEAEARKIARS